MRLFQHFWLQRFLSWFLIGLIIFTQTFHIGWFDRADAYATWYRDIISVFVEDSVYADMGNSIRTYAKNIQTYLGGTRVAIFPVPKDISSYAIAALNEKLFYEWDGNGVSRLVGTVLIGNIPLPVVHNGGKSFISIFPYVDFRDKHFTYNSAKKKFEYSSEYKETAEADIWHWVIHPNSGNPTNDKQALIDFFQKTADYYASSWKYADSVTRDDPYVFYYDGHHEQLSASLSRWKSYELSMKYNEDVAYERWTVDFANALKREQADSDSEWVPDLLDSIASDLAASAPWSPQLESIEMAQQVFLTGMFAWDAGGPDFRNVPDIITKDFITKFLQPFHTVLSKSLLGSESKNVHNAWRYTSGTTVRSDTVAMAVTSQDVIMEHLLRDANTALEWSIDALINTWWLSRKIPVLTDIYFDRQEIVHWILWFTPQDLPRPELRTTVDYSGNNHLNANGYMFNTDFTGSYHYANRFYGAKASTVTKPENCTIIRWSTQTVEANRAYNIGLTRSDVDTLMADPQLWSSTPLCFPWADVNSIKSQTYWGGNTLINVNQEATAASWSFVLGSHRYDSLVYPLYDLAWMRKLDSDSSLLSVAPATSFDCLRQDDLILEPRTTKVCWNWFWDSWCTPPYSDVADAPWSEWNQWSSWNTRLRTDAANIRFTCKSSIERSSSDTFTDYFRTFESAPCTVWNLSLDNVPVKTASNACIYYYLFDEFWWVSVSQTGLIFGSWFMIDDTRYLNPKYKTVSSVMKHVSPTIEELNTAWDSRTTPNLAIDKDRYIDFMSAAWNLQQIYYPNLFRIKLTDKEIANRSLAEATIKDYLDTISATINQLIRSEVPPIWSWLDAQIYNALKSGDYNPTASIDLYSILNRDPKVFNSVVQNVIWNNLKNATAKYAYIFEHYLDEKGSEKAILPLHRWDYEIAYLWGDWDTKNMQVRLDPELNDEDSMSDDMKNSIGSYQSTRAKIDAANITEDSDSYSNNNTDKCGSPDGVNIFFEWFPAILCWIQSLLPPKIIAGSCSASTIGQSSNSSASFDSTRLVSLPTDASITWWDASEHSAQTIEILLDFFSWGHLVAQPENTTASISNGMKVVSYYERGNGDIANLNTLFTTDFIIDRLEIKNASWIYDTVYQIWSNTGILEKYLDLPVNSIPFDNGEASAYIWSKWYEANVTFHTILRYVAQDGTIIVNTISPPASFRLRSWDVVLSVMSWSESISTIGVHPNQGLSLLFSSRDGNGTVTENIDSYQITIRDDVSETLIYSWIVTWSNFDIASTSILNRVWIYRIEATDDRWIIGTTSLTVLPGPATNYSIQQSSNTLVIGQTTPVIIQLLDAYWNLAQGWSYQVKVNMTNGYIVDGNDKKTSIDKYTMDGLVLIEVWSENPGNIQLSFNEVTTWMAGTKTLNSIEYAQAIVHFDSTPIVGWSWVHFDISIVDRNNQPITWFDGIALIDFPASSWRFSGSTIPLQTWRWEWVFVPWTVALDNQKIQFQIPWIQDISGANLSILPGAPMYVDIKRLDSGVFEAKDGEGIPITATVHDRFWNQITNLPSGTKIEFSIPERYGRYGNFENAWTGMLVWIWSDWLARINVVSTGIPGTMYVIGKITPTLSAQIVIQDANWQEIIDALSHWVLKIETSYFLNKEKLDNINYNALYSVLLWAWYGDVSVPEYLWWEILFHKDSRALAVTTLSDDPYTRNILASFAPNGKYIAWSEQDSIIHSTVNVASWRTTISFYDETYKEMIASISPHFQSPANMYVCTLTGTNILDGCNNLDDSRSFIAIQSQQNSIISTLQNNILSLVQSWSSEVLFSINQQGVFTKNALVDVILHEDDASDAMVLSVLFSWNELWKIALFLSTNESVKVGNWSYSSDTLVANILSPRYQTRQTYLWESTAKPYWIAIYTNNEDDEKTVDEIFTEPFAVTWFERYIDSEGVGWKWANKSLLGFAAGDIVWSSNRLFQTILTINLWDPVVHIDPKKVLKNNLDRTIGIPITGSARWNIDSYKTFDINNDWWEDIAIFYTDWHVQVIMNMAGKWHDMWNVAYIADVKEWFKWSGDFSGDWFHDFVMTNTDNQLVFLSNEDGRLSRKKVKILNEDGTISSSTGRIVQMEVFNMDNDVNGTNQIDDLVILTEDGELAILYGSTDIHRDEKIFTKKTLEKHLWLALDTNVRRDGGALYFDELPIIDSLNDTNTVTPSGEDMTSDSTLLSHVYYERRTNDYDNLDISDASITASTVTNLDENGVEITSVWQSVGAGLAAIPAYSMNPGSNIDTDIPPSQEALGTSQRRIYIYSEFAESANTLVSKRFEDVNSGSLQANDLVKVIVSIDNTSTSAIHHIEYLDSLPEIFSADTSQPYSIMKNGIETVASFTDEMIDNDPYFPVYFSGGEVPAGWKVTFSYYAKVLPFAYGTMIVGKLEWWEIGDDAFGDVAFDTHGKSECWVDIMMWRSTDVRIYEKGTKKFTDDTFNTLPLELQKEILRNSTDDDKNGIPDYVDAMKTDPASVQPIQDEAQEKFDKSTAAQDVSRSLDPFISYNDWSESAEIGWMEEDNFAKIEDMMSSISKGLSCWFGGWSCFNIPANWAPLMPWSSLNIMGMPVTEMTVDLWIPGFSCFTGMPIYGVWWCFVIPVCHPVTPLEYLAACSASSLWAGWILGTDATMDFFRFYVSPTLSMGVGAAVCFNMWATSKMVEAVLPEFLTPIQMTGNCVVAAAPLWSCSDDGSDGDAGGAGWLGTFTETWNTGDGWNGSSSCSLVVNPPTDTEKITMVQDINTYLRSGNKEVLKSIYNRSQWKQFFGQLSSRPLLSIGDASNNDGAIDIEISLAKGWNNGKIVKVKNTRIPAFPEFLMDWVNRQVEEIADKLTILPSLYIILPDLSRMNIDKWLDGFWSKVSDHINGIWKGLKNDVSSFGDRFWNSLNNRKSYNSIGGTAVWLRSAYEFLSNLPLINIRTVNIPINIPWIDAAQLEKEITKYKTQIGKYRAEVDSKMRSWGNIGTDNVRLESNKFISSLEKNLRTLEEYKRFPEKLQKLLTWKQRYIEQIICNIRTIEKMLGWWMKDNARRFKKWVEFIILIKTILKWWQWIIDLFNDYQKSCSTCKNERYDLRNWKFKLLSMFIPKIPVIRFPRWPDIVLDLHNIRLWLDISMPEFTIKPVPIVLPNLPLLALPDAPNAFLNIPWIPELPKLPNLPDLPDLPSLPRIELPNLPPPPKIPNILGSISWVLKILKLLMKLLCWLQNTVLVSEEYLGEKVAELTQRQWIHPLDFLNLNFAQLSDWQIPGMKEIRVSTYVNLEFKTDFIAEMARQITRPINSFTSDMTHLLPKNLGTKIDLRSTVPSNVRLNYTFPNSSIDSLKVWDTTLFWVVDTDDLAMSDTDAFKKILLNEISWIDNLQIQKMFYSIINELDIVENNEADIFLADIEKRHEEKFSNLYKYLEFEKMKTLIFQEELQDTIRQSKTISPLTRLNPTSFRLVASQNIGWNIDNPFYDTVIKENKFQYPSNKVDSFQSSVMKEGKKLLSKLDRSVAIDTAPADIGSTNPLNSSLSAPSPVYQWIYTLDTSGRQTRLFDYFDDLDGTEEVIRIDFDHDWDRDYLYRNGDNIVMKINHQFSPARNIDISQNIYSSVITNFFDSVTKSAPNYFHESMTLPNSINISFSPISKELDTYFRLRYYDRVYENDLNKATSLASSSWLHVVDMTIGYNDEESLSLTSSGISSSHISYVSSIVWDSEITGPKIDIKSSSDAPFVFSNWKDLYTGNSSATIQYVLSDDPNNIITQSLTPHTRFHFTQTAEVTITNWELFIDTWLFIDTPVSISAYNPWFPLIPWMKIVPANSSASIVVRSHDTDMRINWGQVYQIIDLGWISDSYYASFQEENSWFYGSLEVLYPNGKSSSEAMLTLMSPQTESDREWPHITLDTTLYIPVYTQKNIDLANVISDTSWIQGIEIDSDVQTDTNWNGILNDDLVPLSDASLSSIPLSVNPTNPLRITLWEFDELWVRTIRILVTDMNNNTSEITLKIIVYAPVPTIESSSGNILYGLIDEEIIWEPVDIIRIRNGVPSIIPPIQPNRNNAVTTFDDGQFSWAFLQAWENWVNLKDDGIGIAIIREDTGKMVTAENIKVIPANKTTPMTFVIDDKYKQSIILQKQKSHFTLVSDFSQISSDGVYAIINSPNQYIVNPLTSLVLPGGISIIEGHQFVFGLAEDWNIYTNDSSVTLKYFNQDDYPGIQVLKNNIEVGKILYHIHGMFSVR